MLSALCSVEHFVADAPQGRMFKGGARSEGHKTIAENGAISVTARLDAILCSGGLTPKLRREGGRLRLQPSSLSG